MDAIQMLNRSASGIMHNVYDNDNNNFQYDYDNDNNNFQYVYDNDDNNFQYDF